MERHGGLEQVDRQALEERALVAIPDDGTVPVAYNRIGRHDVSAMISKSWVRASFSEGDYITWEEREERWHGAAERTGRFPWGGVVGAVWCGGDCSLVDTSREFALSYPYLARGWRSRLFEARMCCKTAAG